MTFKQLKIAYLVRAEFGVIGGAASYMFPSTVGKHHDVLVLESCPHESRKLEPVVFQNSVIPVVNIYDDKKVIRMRNKLNVLSDFSPDIVHVFQSAKCLYDVMQLRRLPSKPIIILDFRTPLYAPKSVRVHFAKLKNFFKCQFYIDWVITHSNLTLRSNLPLRLKRFTEIPPGVDLAKFNPNNIRSQNPNKFIFIGSLARTRRIDLFIDFFRHAITELDSSLTLDIYGQGDAASDIQNQIENYNLQNSISLKGVMTQKGLFKVISKYDVGIAYIPDEGVGSMFSKAPSLKSLEYAAAGIPIIASATTGHKYYQDKHGFVFELFNNNCDDFVKVIDKISKNGVLNNMVDQNLIAVKKFDWNHIVESKLLPLYDQLVNKP